MVYVDGGTEFALHVKVMFSTLGFVKQNLILLGLPTDEKIILTGMNMMQCRNRASSSSQWRRHGETVGGGGRTWHSGMLPRNILKSRVAWTA